MVVLAADATDNSKVWFIGGPYYGIVRNQSGVQQFSPAGTEVTISPGADFYLIYQVDKTDGVNLGSNPNPTPPGDTFSGTATINNGYDGQAVGPSFRAVEIFLDGLFVRTGSGNSCTL